MLITIFDQDDVAIEIDTARYRYDTGYRGEIHEKMRIPHDLPPLDWDRICAPEEELRAFGTPIFDSADYLTEDAFIEALARFLTDLCDDPDSDSERS